MDFGSVPAPPQTCLRPSASLLQNYNRLGPAGGPAGGPEVREGGCRGPSEPGGSTSLRSDTFQAWLRPGGTFKVESPYPVVPSQRRWGGRGPVWACCFKRLSGSFIRSHLRPSHVQRKQPESFAGVFPRVLFLQAASARLLARGYRGDSREALACFTVKRRPSERMNGALIDLTGSMRSSKG